MPFEPIERATKLALNIESKQYYNQFKISSQQSSSSKQNRQQNSAPLSLSLKEGVSESVNERERGIMCAAKLEQFILLYVNVFQI